MEDNSSVNISKPLNVLISISVSVFLAVSVSWRFKEF